MTSEYMNTKPDQRPISPYMLGPYYRFQITSLLSITSRITGVWLAVGATPLAVIWLWALLSGPDVYGNIHGLYSTLIGQVLVLGSLFSVCYHLVNGIRHLLWDTGRFLEMDKIRLTGWIMLAMTAVLFLGTWWAAS